MFRTFLSWRYLVSRRTNLIGIVGIFVGVGALIMILSIMTGFLDESRRAIRGSLADIVISPDFGYLADGPDDLYSTGPEAILELLSEDARIVAATPHLGWFGVLLGEGYSASDQFTAQASSELRKLPLVALVGIDVETELEATDLLESLECDPVSGYRVADPRHPFAPPPGYRPAGRPKSAVILGEQLLDEHRLRPGDEINLGTLVSDAATGELAESNRKYVVAGSFRSRDNEMDGKRIYMERRELEDLIGGVRSYSEILVKLADYDEQSEEVRADLQDRLLDAGLIAGLEYEVLTWEEFRGNLLGAIENERVLMAIMLSLVLVVAGFTVFAILSMMVTEKRRDIGILTAVGATPRGVLTLFLLIGLWDAVIGATLGAVAGIWMAINIDPIERWLSDRFGVQIFNRNVYLFDHIPARVIPEAVAAIVIGAILLTLLFAAIPAWSASRQDPLQALRNE